MECSFQDDHRITLAGRNQVRTVSIRALLSFQGAVSLASTSELLRAARALTLERRENRTKMTSLLEEKRTDARYFFGGFCFTAHQCVAHMSH